MDSGGIVDGIEIILEVDNHRGPRSNVKGDNRPRITDRFGVYLVVFTRNNRGTMRVFFPIVHIFWISDTILGRRNEAFIKHGIIIIMVVAGI